MQPAAGQALREVVARR